MNISVAKENILKKIRKALSESTPLPFAASEGNQSVFHPQGDELELLFAETFSQLQGRFSFCVNRQELGQQLELLMAQKGIKKIVCPESVLFSVLSSSPALQQLLADSTGVQLKDCDAGITGCELLVARTGTIVLSAAQAQGRTTSVYAPIHICIATADQLVYDVRDGLKFLREKYGSALPSLMSFASGPSRTADIEKTLVVGVHGPKEVYLFLVDQL
jgi:L-lactate dehydrogenase complex protein LldG